MKFLVSGENSFDKLKVKIREQVVSVLPASSNIDETATLCDPKFKPVYLEAEQFHREILENASLPDFLLFDTRNIYETMIGHFKGAIFLHSLTFKENMQKMEEILEKRDKGKAVYMYCTGGIRCSKAGALLAMNGYTNIRMLQGGITLYGQYIKKSGQKSLFIGKNFTFDNRMVRVAFPIIFHLFGRFL